MPSRPRKYVALGSLIRDARERRGIKQAFVADALSVSGPWLSMVERGIRRPPLSLIESLYKAVGLTNDEWDVLLMEWERSSPVRSIYPTYVRMLIEEIIEAASSITPDGIERIRAAIIAETGAVA